MAEKMLPIKEAQEILLDRIDPLPVVEVPLWQAVGLPAARPVTTDIDLSPFANSAMDGYAVRTADLAAASPEAPVALDVVGHEAAGHVFEGQVGAGEAVRIMTGAPVPEGADAVVKYEVVTVTGGDGNEGSQASFTAPAKPGENIREAGLEARAGGVVIEEGEVLTPAGCGLAASAGATAVPVHRAPRIGIISLGTELVAPGERPGRGQIRDSNSSALMAAAAAAGAEPEFYGIAPDDRDAIEAVIRRAASSCDMVVTSGGASAGDYDYVTALVAREGEVLFDRIAMKPGKAITFGIFDGTPFLGLSGNPAAAVVGFELLARPAIRKMRGHRADARPRQVARLTHDVRKRGSRRLFNRARVERDPRSGVLEVTEMRSQNSALLSTMQRANCLLEIAEDAAGPVAGEMVDVVRIDIEEGTEL
ncbi:MAG: molybdopterin molybdotransferase MoeA [Coriobacteriaceae bacterium]|nr:molybdopterin molybdotransferase MoeA [Coriobacteriaceae bacterium]